MSGASLISFKLGRTTEFWIYSQWQQKWYCIKPDVSCALKYCILGKKCSSKAFLTLKVNLKPTKSIEYRNKTAPKKGNLQPYNHIVSKIAPQHVISLSDSYLVPRFWCYISLGHIFRPPGYKSGEMLTNAAHSWWYWQRIVPQVTICQLGNMILKYWAPEGSWPCVILEVKSGIVSPFRSLHKHGVVSFPFWTHIVLFTENKKR